MKKSLIDECRISIAGCLFYHLLPIRRDIVLKNIDRVFNDTYSAKEKKHLAKSFYSHLFSTLREFFFMSWYSEEKLNNMVEIRGIEHLVTAQNQGQGCLLLTGHLGNWELTSLVAFSRLKTLIGTVHEIRKAIRVKWLERFIFKRVTRYGIQRIDKQGASRKIIRTLKKKEIVLFIMDQHAALKHKEGIAVDFFGSKSGTYRSLAFFCQ